jgi:hypothetical protein
VDSSLYPIADADVAPAVRSAVGVMFTVSETPRRSCRSTVAVTSWAGGVEDGLAWVVCECGAGLSEPDPETAKYFPGQRDIVDRMAGQRCQHPSRRVDVRR